MSYEDDARSPKKVRSCAPRALGGTIIWTISQGHIAGAPPGQRDPLLDAIRAAFLE